MPSQTPNVGLYKVNGETDGNDTFNVDVVLNDNWDKLDAAVGQIQEDLGNVTVPDASLTEKGIVQLSNATNSTSEVMAATPKAVKDAYDKANAAETPAGAQAKANAAETNAKNYVDGKSWQKRKLTEDNGKSLLLSPGYDLNTLVANGFYNGNNLINAPITSPDVWFYVEVQCHSNAETYVLQRASILNGGVNSLYQRTRENGIWRAWSQDLFTSVANGKLSIANAINDKSPGLWTPATATFDEMAAAIRQIPVGKEYYEANLGTIAASGFLNFDTGFRARIITVASTYSPTDISNVLITTTQVMPYGGPPASAPIATSQNGGYMSIRKGDGNPFYTGDVADGKFLTTSFRVQNLQTAPWYNILVRAWA